MTIVVLDGYGANPGDLSWERLYELGEVSIYDRTAPDEIVERAKGAEAIFTNKVIIDKQVMQQLPRLRYIGVLATGYNVVDMDEASRRGITVTNIPAYSTFSVAQMTFAHILNITNRIGRYARHNKNGRWCSSVDFCYWDTPLHELAGKTMGIVGLGNIGMHVAKIAQDFGMDVFALTSKNSSDLPEGIRKTTLEGLLAVSDILSLHCPLTDDTFEMINKQTLAKMKQGSILINTGRGPLVNEQDVADALYSGHLAGYGADVLTKEPPAEDCPLLKAPNAFITPHIAWATVEARERLMNTAFENLADFINGTPQNVVNNL